MLASVVRNKQLTAALGVFMLSYLYRGLQLTGRDVRLMQGVIYRTYFDQFQFIKDDSDESDQSEEQEFDQKIQD